MYMRYFFRFLVFIAALLVSFFWLIAFFDTR